LAPSGGVRRYLATETSTFLLLLTCRKPVSSPVVDSCNVIAGLRARFARLHQGPQIHGTAPMADDHIRYDILAQDALRGVMRKVLGEVMRTGLPGNHHFFITFL